METIKAKTSVEETTTATATTETIQSPSVAEQIKLLDNLVTLGNPYGKCCYNMEACHGIAKALMMLFPKGRGDGSKMPSDALVVKVRRFLKVKVKRRVKLDDTCWDLPSVEALLLPGLFSVDLNTPSHLRIQGREVLTLSLLPKTVWVAAACFNVQEKLQSQGKTAGDKVQDIPTDEMGRFVASVKHDDIPKIAQILTHRCIIPGGPWSVYRVICEQFLHPSDKSKRFEDVQAQLLQSNNRNAGQPDPVLEKTLPSLHVVHKIN